MLLGNILGLNTAIEVKNIKKNRKKSHYLKWYVPLVIIIILAQYAVFIWRKMEDNNGEGHFIQFILESMSNGTLTMDLLITIFFLNYTRYKKWIALNKYLIILENNLIHHRCKDSGILGHIYIDISFITLLFSVIQAFSFYVFFIYHKIFLYVYVTRIYFLYMMLLVYLIVTRIRTGVKQLHAFLEALSPRNIEGVNRNVKFVQSFNMYSEFMKNYRIIFNIVQLFNDIFGYHMVFLNLNCILEWLSSLNAIIVWIKYYELHFDIIIIILLQTAIILVSY